MFPIEMLRSSVPAYRLAGGFGIEAFGLLWPVSDGKAGERIRFLPLAQVGDSFDPAAVFREEFPLQVHPSTLRDHVLVVRPRAEFFSNDRLAVSNVSANDGEWRIDFCVTRVESQDLEPAPRDLYVVIALDAGDALLRRLMLQFKARGRSFQGVESAMNEPAALPEVIEFLE
jgi:hypothetical protein